MISHGCMIGPPAATGKGIQIIGRVPIIGERRVVDVTDGLIHRWRLTENANDAVGTLHLTNNNSVTFSANGASFNGSNQYLGLGTITMPTQGTIIAFVRPSAWGANVAPVHVGDGGDGSGYGVLWDGSKIWFIYYPKRYVNSGLVWNAATFPSSTWTLLGVKYDGTTTIGYKNATAYSGTTVNVSAAYTKLSLGTLNVGSYGYWYAGHMADVRIYNRALTDEEVSVLAANGPNP